MCLQLEKGTHIRVINILHVEKGVFISARYILQVENRSNIHFEPFSKWRKVDSCL